MSYVVGLVSLSLLCLVAAGIYVDSVRKMEHNTRAIECVKKNAIYVPNVTFYDKKGIQHREFMCIHAQEVK